ncbi:MAG: hypothetical protein HYS53_02385 [Candidatus Aenigmarchaeota archaeon]|nr:hypothetical protein [Candidatus Aenigmarchaeota archaeon]
MKNKMAAAMLMLVLLANAMPVSASVVSPTYYAGSPGHYYQAVFDGEGEAAVIAKVIQLNTEKEKVDKITLEIPGRSNIRYIFQEIYPKQKCLNYDNSALKCITYDYGYPYYQRGYVNLDFAEEQLSWSKKVVVNLAEPIEQGATGSLIIYYKAFGYVDKNVNFDFDFETIKSPFDTPYLRVSVSVDEDLSLRGGETKTTYIPNFASLESFGTQKMAALPDEQSNFIRTISDKVVYAGGYVKTKTNLDPWESFHVTGRYNEKNLWFLNYHEWIIGVVAAIFVVNFLMKGGLLKGVSDFIKKARKFSLSRVIFTGFLSAAAVTLTIAAITLLGSSLYYLFRNQIGSVLILVASSVAVLFSIAFPAYYHAQKYGNKEGAAVLVSTIIWLVAVAYMLSGFSGDMYYTMGRIAAGV